MKTQMPVPIPYGLNLSANLALALFSAAAATAKFTAKQGKVLLSPRRKPRLTLKPGTGTPVWNELVARAQTHLFKRGSKVRLARFLGLPRQRLQDVLKSHRACLDAERTLLLLCWVAAQDQGKDLAV